MTRAFGLQQSALHTSIVAVVVLALAMLTAPALAQVEPGSFEIGFDAGALDFDSDESDDVAFRASFRAGYFFTPHWQLEGQVIGANEIFETNLRAIMINGVYNFRPDTKVVPYVLVGVGYSELEDDEFLSNRPTITADGEAFQAAIGSRFYFSDRQNLALRVELAMLFEDNLFDSEHPSLAAGLSWRLGK